MHKKEGGDRVQEMRDAAAEQNANPKP